MSNFIFILTIFFALLIGHGIGFWVGYNKGYSEGVAEILYKIGKIMAKKKWAQ